MQAGAKRQCGTGWDTFNMTEVTPSIVPITEDELIRVGSKEVGNSAITLFLVVMSALSLPHTVRYLILWYMSHTLGKWHMIL